MVKLPRVRMIPILGTYLPNTVIGLVAALFGGTILGVLLAGAGVPLIAAGALMPDRVLQGEIWRLVTWTFFELNPIGLIFSCLMLGFLGRDLSSAWGHWRFVGMYLALASLVGAGVCLVALAWPAVARQAYATAWPIGDALLVSWASQFPNRQILMYFVLPIGGRNLVYLVIAGTLLFALFGGLALFVPHFLAIVIVLVFMRRTALDLVWLRLRLAMTRRTSQSAARLHVVRKEEGEPKGWLH